MLRPSLFTPFRFTDFLNPAHSAACWKNIVHQTAAPPNDLLPFNHTWHIWWARPTTNNAQNFRRTFATCQNPLGLGSRHGHSWRNYHFALLNVTVVVLFLPRHSAIIPTCWLRKRAAHWLFTQFLVQRRRWFEVTGRTDAWRQLSAIAYATGVSLTYNRCNAEPRHAWLGSKFRRSSFATFTKEQQLKHRAALNSSSTSMAL